MSCSANTGLAGQLGMSHVKLEIKALVAIHDKHLGG